MDPPGSPVVEVASLEAYRRLVEGPQLRNWAFRGEAHADWPLYSGLSRHLRYAGVHASAWTDQERRVLRIFRRKAHLFLDHIPAEDDSFQWLALMQHHGAPTRLIDLTWSPYVALFFALERGAARAVVWAFNAPAINARQHELRNGRRLDLRRASNWEPGSYERDFLAAKDPFLIIGEPKVMNRRLVAQSGTFLVPGVLDRPIEQIVAGYVRSRELATKIVLDVPAMRNETMRQLYSMNITNASLFPDLEGLARSMAYELEHHWAFDPRTMAPEPGFEAGGAEDRRAARDDSERRAADPRRTRSGRKPRR